MTDSLEDFLKQCESHAQHNKTNTNNKYLDISPNEKIQETCSQKAHGTITGIYRAKETLRIILITYQIIEKGRIIVTIIHSVWKSNKEAKHVNIQLQHYMLHD